MPQLPLCVEFGGFELQALETRNALRSIGIAAQFLNFETPRSELDLLHLFGPSLGALDILKQATLPVVISTLFSGAVPSIYRDFVRRCVGAGSSLLRQPSSFFIRRETFRLASRVLCLNMAEAEFAQRAYGIDSSALVVIPNGVGGGFFDPSPDCFVEKYGISDFVLFVGSVAERKNPLLLAQAAQRLGLRAVFIGLPAANEQTYAKAMDTTIAESPGMIWIKGLSHEDPCLVSAYAAASTFCLPSTAETQSIAALQALASRTPTILGDRPYAYAPPFENVARCDPLSVKSIEHSLRSAHTGPRPAPLSSRYRWANVAAAIVGAYRSVMTNVAPESH